jgi:hypothetical protein
MEEKLAAIISGFGVPMALHSQIALSLPGSNHLQVGSNGVPKGLSCRFFLTTP